MSFNIINCIIPAYYKQTAMQLKFFKTAPLKRLSVQDATTIALLANRLAMTETVSLLKPKRAMSLPTETVNVLAAESKQHSFLMTAEKVTFQCPRMSPDYLLAWTKWLYQAHRSKMVLKSPITQTFLYQAL